MADMILSDPEHADNGARPKRLRCSWRTAEQIACDEGDRERLWLAEMDAMPARFGLCYFIGNIEHGLVKIGYSRSVVARLHRLRSGSLYPLSILVTLTGADERERYYHKRFHASAIGGEWFEITPDILAEIERLRAPLTPSICGGGA